MQAKWGTAAMPVNGAEVTSQLTVVEATEYGAPLRYGATYNVKVWLDGSGQDDLTAKEIAFRRALAVQNQDFILFTDGGKRSSANILVADTASGTRVTSVSAPEAQGGEFVNRRTIAFTITAELHAPGAENALVSFQETLTITGNGGPRRLWRFPVNAKALRQVITPGSLVTATQQGKAVGYLKRPKRPLPIFRDYQVNDREGLTIDSPKFMGLGNDPVDYAVSWYYQFERGDGPLVGVPTNPRGVV